MGPCQSTGRMKGGGEISGPVSTSATMPALNTNMNKLYNVRQVRRI